MHKYNLLIIFTFSLFLSCTPKNMMRDCNPREYKESEIITLKFPFNNAESVTINNAKSFLYDSINKINIVEEVPLDSFYFQELLNQVSQNNIDSNAFLTILYYDTVIMYNSVVLMSHVKGVGIYSLGKDKFNFKLFTSKDLEFTELLPLSTETNVVSNNSIIGIAQNIIFRDKKNYTIFYIDKFDGKNHYSVTPGKDLLYDKIKNFVNHEGKVR